MMAHTMVRNEKALTRWIPCISEVIFTFRNCQVMHLCILIYKHVEVTCKEAILRYEAFVILECHTDECRGGCADVSPIKDVNSILDERPEFWVVEDFRGACVIHSQ
jgi:hypothetical protein